MAEEFTKYKQTDDDWHPTLAGSMVKVPFQGDRPSYKFLDPDSERVVESGIWHRVSVWGGDDFGLERDYKGGEREQALSMYQNLSASSKVNIRMLLEMGFMFA